MSYHGIDNRGQPVHPELLHKVVYGLEREPLGRDIQRNMDISESSDSANADFTPAAPIEISLEVAEQADELLRELAEDAGLDTALIVDQNGALVTGISAEENVTVDLISALVAGASGAMKTLVREMGETGEIESLHQGSERSVYLREIVGRFFLVGVAEASLPVGLTREKSNQMRGRFAELLNLVKPTDFTEKEELSESAVMPRTLREVAIARAAERAARDPEVDEDDPLVGIDDDPVVDDENVFFDLGKLTAVAEGSESSGDESSAAEEESIFELEEEEAEIEEEEEEQRDPTEVIEPLELDEPEIVIEPEEGPPAESPFEIDEEEEEEELVVPETIVLEEGAPVESIFELEADEVEEEEDDAVEAVDEGSAVEIDDKEDFSGIFEVDSDSDEEESDLVSELGDDDSTNADGESAETSEGSEAEEEKEVGGSGPFYF